MSAFPPFDPLKASPDAKSGEVAVRREVERIVASYSGWYDPFAELIDNALDAIEEAIARRGGGYRARIHILIDLAGNTLTVTDNGSGLTRRQFEAFIAPGVTFKPAGTRRYKGAGMTYLAYGVNDFQVCTSSFDFAAVGRMMGGRNWLADGSGLVARPTLEPDPRGPIDRSFSGAGMSVTLGFDSNSHPADLSWLKADTATQWYPILLRKTRIGAVLKLPPVEISLTVIAKDGQQTKLVQPAIEHQQAQVGQLRDELPTEADRAKAAEIEAQLRETERLDAERKETERIEAERREGERIEAQRAEAERLEAERINAEKRETERLEAERREAERIEAENREAGKREAERVETEKREAERIEVQKREAERAEAEKFEAALIEAEKREAECIEAEKREAERIEAEKREAERIETEKRETERIEAERIEAEKREAERIETEKREAERVEAEKREAERIVAEKQESERVEAERREAERIEAARPKVNVLGRDVSPELGEFLNRLLHGKRWPKKVNIPSSYNDVAAVLIYSPDLQENALANFSELHVFCGGSSMVEKWEVTGHAVSRLPRDAFGGMEIEKVRLEAERLVKVLISVPHSPQGAQIVERLFDFSGGAPRIRTIAHPMQEG
jgi:hypothetical protein